MGEYHGDIMYRVAPPPAHDDDKNYFVAILLLQLFGATGAHRFYLNDQRGGWIYFTPFAVIALMSMAMLDLSLLYWEIIFVSPFLAMEFAWFGYKIIGRIIGARSDA